MNATLALNPDTGKLVWYYQHIPSDPYDMDYAFEHILAPVTVRGERHKALITAGKPAIFEAVDAATGKFLFAVDPGVQNVATAIDPEPALRTYFLKRRRRASPAARPTPVPETSRLEHIVRRRTGITCRSTILAWERWATRQRAFWRWI